MAPSTLRHRPALLSARLKDIQLVGTLEKKRDHFVVMRIDEVDVATSERKNGLAPLRWEQEHTLQFRPSSIMTIKLFRHSIFSPRRPHHIGHHTRNITQLFENNSELELTDDSTGHLIPARLTINLTIIPDLAKDVMKRVDDDLAASGLNNPMLASASSHIENAVAISRVGSDAVKVLGSCVEPLGNALKMFVKVMDSVADGHPIVKAAWTVLSATYKAIQAQMLQDESVVSLAESLREMLGVVQEVPDLTVIEGTSDVIDEIGRVSLEVASLIDEYTRSSFGGRTAKYQTSDDMKTRVDKCQRNCADLMEKFRTRVGIGAMKDIKIIKDQILARDISAWLNAPDNSQNYNDACKKHHESTGSWFIDGKEFSKWKECGWFLCIYGKAGCGKTVLCSSIITNVIHMCKEKESSACAYFFFDGRDAQTGLQRHDGFIRSLVRQFWAQYDGIPAPLVQLYGKGYQQPSTDTLEDVLQQICSGFTDSYIIIDSLDECTESTERRELLTWINKNSSSKTGNLSLLVTSRPEEDIKTNLQPLDPVSITMEERLVNDDIQAFIDSKMKEGRLGAWPEEVQLQVKRTLMAKAQGMFRWLAMQLEELQNCFDVAELDEQLERLPKDLDETYSRILARIPEQRRTRTKIFLQWTAFSARPPSLEELGEAAAVDFDKDDLPKYNPRRRYRPQDVLAACASLIMESDGHVKLAHFSVKEYLVSERIVNGAASFFSISEKLSHSIIAKTSLAYLLQLDSTGPLERETLADVPLAVYAASNWVFHVRSGNGDGERATTKLIVNLLESEKPLVNWIRLWDPENLQHGIQLRISSTEVAEPLYYTSILGFKAASQHLLDNGASVNPQRAGGDRALEKSSYMRYGNALQAACHEGQVGVVQFLLEKNVDVNTQGGKYGSALQAAAWICDKKIVKLLLERGADVNMRGGEYGCALQAAACGGDVTMVKLLLENGADVHMQGGRYHTALQAAVFNGHREAGDLLMEKGTTQTSIFGPISFLEVVNARDLEKLKSLLEKGMDANMDLGFVGSPLHFTSIQGHTEVVGLLLSNHADVNRQAGVFGSPLQAACCGGGMAIVKLLLENNADVNAQGGLFGNALMMSVLRSHDDIVKLLLENHADVNARTKVQTGLFGNAPGAMTLQRFFHEREVDIGAEDAFSYALHVASSYGRREIVNMLLDHGADVNAQGGYFGNALRAAMAKGHVDIAKLLLEHGATLPPELQQKDN